MKPSRFPRREFLKQGLSHACVLSAMGSQITAIQKVFAQADPSIIQDPHFLLILRTPDGNGGMDSLMGLNPWFDTKTKPSDLYLGPNYHERVLRDIGGTKISLGPAAHALAPYVSEFSIVNGLFMGRSDIGHQAATKYLLTTNSGGTFPDQGVSIISQASGDPNIITNSRLDIASIKNKFRIDLLNNSNTSISDNFYKMLSLYDDSNMFQKENKIENSKKEQLDFFVKKGEEITLKFKDRDDKTPGLPNNQLNKVIAGFASNYYQMAEVELSENSLDSHSNFDDSHIAAQTNIWNTVAEIIYRLKETSFQDTETSLYPNYVTILVLNEFGRLPFLNSTQGKDHNLLENSFLIGGKGIRPSQVIGGCALYPGSDQYNSKFSGLPIDYRTGNLISAEVWNAKREAFEKDLNVGLIRPENLWMTLQKAWGNKNIISTHKGRALEGLLKT